MKESIPHVEDDDIFDFLNESDTNEFLLETTEMLMENDLHKTLQTLEALDDFADLAESSGEYSIVEKINRYSNNLFENVDIFNTVTVLFENHNKFNHK